MNHSKLIDELLNELSYRVGIVDLKNKNHQSIISEILSEWEEYDAKQIIMEFLTNEDDTKQGDSNKKFDGYTHIGAGVYVDDSDVDDDGKAKKGAQKYKSDGKSLTAMSDDEYNDKKTDQGEKGEKVAADTPQNQQGDENEKSPDDIEKEKGVEKTVGSSSDYAKREKERVDKVNGTKSKDDEKKEKSQIDKIRIPAKKETANTTKKRRNEINKLTDSVIKKTNGSSTEIKTLIEDRREGLVQLYDTPPGGGGSLVGEMYGGVAAEELSKNPNLSEDEFVSQKMEELEETPLYGELLEKAKASKATQKNPKKYIEDWLRVAYKTGKAEVDYLKSESKFKYKEPQSEPYPISFTMDFNQSQIIKSKLEVELENAKNSGDTKKIKHYEKQLRILERLPDTDTGILYETTDGLVGFKHTSNKNDWNDPHNNTSVREKGKKMEKSIESISRENNLDDNISKELVDDINNLVSETADLVDSAERVVERDIKGVNSNEFAKNNAEVLKHLNPKRIDYPQQIRIAPSVKAYFLDKGIDINDVSDTELLEAVVEMTKNGTAPQDVSKIVLKISELTKAVRIRREEGLAKYGGPMNNEQIAENLGLPSSVVESLQNPINDSILNTNRARKDTMGVAHEQIVSGILSKDEELAQKLDKDYYPNPDDADNGPATQAYVSSFMDEIHFSRYINGEFEGIQSINIGGTNVTPSHFRSCLGKLSGFDGDANNDREGLTNHLRKRMRVNPNGPEISFGTVSDGKSIQVGREMYRTKGNSKSILAHLGKDLISCLKENTK